MLGLHDMDSVQRSYYEWKFHTEFGDSKGDAFQRLFEKLMSKVHLGDFRACRPWGSAGDRKCDGYLPSARILFQCYAPNELKDSSAIKKIKEDFEGAKTHWVKDFDEWTFVHNAPGGSLGPHIIKELNRLEAENPQIKISTFGYYELRAKFRQLSLQDLESWYGLAPTVEANRNLGYADLKAVLDHILVAPYPESSEVKDVSRGKIEANLLSKSVADFLKNGMQKSKLVMEFFDNYNNPVYGEQIASAFKSQYSLLKDATPPLHPDKIYGELLAWAGGTANKEPNHLVAVMAVLAYLFDRCDIFEDAKAVSPA